MSFKTHFGSQNKSVILMAGISYFFAFIAFPLGYFIRLLYANSLSVSDFGLFYALIAFLGLIAIFNDLGLSETLNYFIPRFLSDKRKDKIKASAVYALFFQTFSALIVAALLFFLSDFLGEFYFKSQSASLLIKLMSLYFLFFNIANTIVSVFRGYQKTVYYTSYDFARLFVIFFFSLLAFFIIPKESLLAAYAIIWGFSFFIIDIVYFILLRMKIPEIFYVRFRYDKGLLKKMISYAIPVILSSSAALVLSYTDTIMLTLLRNLEQVAYYNIAFPTANFILLFFMPLALVIFPLFSELHHAKSRDSLALITSAIYNTGIYLVMPISILFSIYPEIIIRILFGEQFVAASPALRILALGFFFNGLNIINFNMLAGFGMVKERARIMYIGLFFNIIANIMLISLYGFVGAAIATSSGFLLMTILSFNYVSKEVGYTIRAKSIIRIFFCALLFVVTVSITKEILSLNPYVEALISALVSGAIYAYAGIKLKVLDIKAIRKIIIDHKDSYKQNI